MKANIQDRTNFVVTQSNQLVEANYSANLTTLAHKIAKLIISFIHPIENQNNLNVTIEISKLKQYLGWSEGRRWNRFYNDLKDISKRLNKEPIEIVLGEGKILVAYFLSSYTLDMKRGEVTFKVSPDLVPHLTHLKRNFTSYQLKYIPALSSSYAIRLYELLYQYSKIGKRKFEIEEFKKKVGAPEKYRYNDLKKRVIIPARKQLKAHTNIAFVFNEIKTGRSITSIEFIIFGNTPSPKSKQIELDFLTDILEENQDIPALSETIIKAMNELGISEQNVAKYLAKGFDIISGSKDTKNKVIQRCQTLENYYLEKLELTKNSSNRDNLAGFFIKALKEDWTNSKTLKKSKQDTAKKAISTAKKQLEQLEKQLNKLSKQRNIVQTPIVMALIANDEVLKATQDAVLTNMSAFSKKFHAETLLLPMKEQISKSPIVSSEISIHLMKTYPEHFKEVTALDKQMETLKTELKTLKSKHPNI